MYHIWCISCWFQMKSSHATQSTHPHMNIQVFMHFQNYFFHHNFEVFLQSLSHIAHVESSAPHISYQQNVQYPQWKNFPNTFNIWIKSIIDHFNIQSLIRPITLANTIHLQRRKIGHNKLWNTINNNTPLGFRLPCNILSMHKLWSYTKLPLYSIPP